MNHKTIGSVVYDILQKEPETKDPIALEREMQKNYLDELIECVKNHEKIFESDFFVIVLTKNEKALANRVIRNYFFARVSCPTPNYDQSVFKYHKKTGDLEYIWTIPSRGACYHLIDHKNEVVKEEQELLQLVLDYADGTLMRRCLELNGEMNARRDNHT